LVEHGTVKTITLNELRENTDLFRQHESIQVKDGGRTLGVFQPLPEPNESIPLEERHKRFLESSERLSARMDALGITEEDVQRDFEEFRKRRRGQ